MISILAPSKTLDETPAPSWVVPSTALFTAEASQIAKTIAALGQDELVKIMGISPSLAAATHRRIAAWGQVQKPALWLYQGDVYRGMYARNLTKDEVEWAQQRLRIMSGLYGMLRPCDMISPYRLEMKTKLAVGDAPTLYAFWADRLAKAIDSESKGVICNLSSDEYARPVTKYTQSRVVTPVFMDHKPNGTIGPVPIYSKMMRGVMARWMIEQRTEQPDDLRHFRGHGYCFDASRSTADRPAFVRAAPMTPLVF